MAVQGLATLPLVFLGTNRTIALVVLIPALFIGFYGHVAAIVAYTVTGTSGVPDGDQGLATGLTSMTQEVGGTVGTPVLAAIAATQAVHLTGMHLALSVDVALTLVSVVARLVRPASAAPTCPWRRRRRRRPRACRRPAPRMTLTASAAPTLRSIPASSHSTEIGPSYPMEFRTRKQSSHCTSPWPVE